MTTTHETPATTDLTLTPHPLDETATALRRYMEMPEDAVIACTLFAAHTVRADAIEYAAFLHITAATEQSGKTRLSDLLSRLVSDPESMTLATEASLRRVAHRFTKAGPRPTFLIDEADKALRDDRVLALLNHSFAPGHTIPLTVQDEDEKWHVVSVDPFGPKIIIGIGGLPDSALASRCLPIRLTRRAPGADRLPRLTQGVLDAEVAPVGERLRAWAATVQVPDLDRVELPEELSDRECDLWLPLFVMADAAGGDWPRLAREAAVRIHSGKVRRRSVIEILLDDVARVFEAEECDTISTAALNEALTDSEDYEWGNYRSATSVPFNTIEQARLLNDIGIKHRRMRQNGEANARRYLSRDQFADAWQRYGITPPQEI